MNQEKKIQEITVFFLTESRFGSKHNVSDRKDSSEFLESSQIFFTLIARLFHHELLFLS